MADGTQLVIGRARIETQGVGFRICALPFQSCSFGGEWMGNVTIVELLLAVNSGQVTYFSRSVSQFSGDQVLTRMSQE